MKYKQRPCNATDCNNWINDPELCKKCLEDSFSMELDVIDLLDVIDTENKNHNKVYESITTGLNEALEYEKSNCEYINFENGSQIKSIKTDTKNIRSKGVWIWNY